MTEATYVCTEDGRFVVDAPCFLFSSSDEAYNFACGHPAPRLRAARERRWYRAALAGRPADPWAALRAWACGLVEEARWDRGWDSRLSQGGV